MSEAVVFGRGPTRAWFFNPLFLARIDQRQAESAFAICRRSARRQFYLPFLHLPFGFRSGDAVAFLYPSDQLLSATLNLIEVVVGQLAPFLADFSFELQPLTLERVFIHLILQFRVDLCSRRSCHVIP